MFTAKDERVVDGIQMRFIPMGAKSFRHVRPAKGTVGRFLRMEA